MRSESVRERAVEEKEAIQELLRGDVWQMVRSHLNEHLQFAIENLVRGRALSLDEIRFRQGRIDVLKQLVDTPKELLIAETRR